MNKKFDQYLDALERHSENPDNIWIHQYFLEYGRKIEELLKRIEDLEKDSTNK